MRFFVSHAYRRATAGLAICFLLMRTTSLAYVGKVRQQAHTIHVDQYVMLLLQLSVAHAARGVCALESSSYGMVLTSVSLARRIRACATSHNDVISGRGQPHLLRGTLQHK